MTLQSPAENDLILIEGDPNQLNIKGQDLICAAETMDKCANRLEAIFEGTSTLKSEGITEVRKAAGEVFPDLRKAATRYSLTGGVLKTYAGKLDEVQTQMTGSGTDHYTSLAALMSDIDAANEAVESKLSAENDARKAEDRSDGMWFGINEGTPEEQEEAKREHALATEEREQAEDELDKLWGHFDARVSYWETAFDQAVNDIEEAFETADNQDKWYDHVADVLSIAGMVLFVVALVATGPLAAIAAALAVVVGLASLLIEIHKLRKGEGSWESVIIAGVSVLPFGKFAGKGFKFLSKSQPFRTFGKQMVSKGRSTLNKVPKTFDQARGMARGTVNKIKGFKIKVPDNLFKSKARITQEMVEKSVRDNVPKIYRTPTGSTWNRMKTNVSNEWNEMVHPYRQWKAAKQFTDAFKHKFHDRSFADRFGDNMVLGYKESRNHVLAGHIMDHAQTAGPDAVAWAKEVQSNRTHDLISGTVDFLSGVGFNSFGTGQTVLGWTK